MNIIKANAQYMDANNMHPYKFMEKCGRICYKSENNITEESATKFVKGLLKSEHTAMLEHAHIILKTTNGAVQNFEKILNDIANKNGPNLYYFNITRNDSDSDDGNYISGSFRSFINFTNVYHDAEINGVLTKEYPEIFTSEYLVESHRYQILTREEFKKDVENIYGNNPDYKNTIISKHLVHTVVFTCDRGITHEFVRHRPASFAQESTRYCNYSKDKFGKEITVIEPCFFEPNSLKYKIWKDACEYAEKSYFELLDNNCTPQEARDVLPTSVKTELVLTATEYEWQHIINLRLHGTTGAPHPQIKEVMNIAMPFLIDFSDYRLM